MSILIRIKSQFSYDTDALAYFTRVETNGGALDENGKSIYNQFFIGLKNDNLWDKIIDMGGFVGVSNVSGALQKIKGLSNDTLSYSSVPTGYNSTGLNAGLKAISRLNPTILTNNLNRSDNAYGFYCTETGGAGQAVMGYAANVAIYDHACYQGATGWNAQNFRYTASINAAPFTGCLICTRTGSSDVTTYMNGASNTTALAVSTSPVTQNIAIFARNLGGSNPFAGRLTLYFYSQGLNPTDAANMTTRINTLMAGFGANVF